MARNNILLVMLLLHASLTWSKTNRYLVYFTDKLNSTYNLNSPEEFLSPRAVERRFNQNISYSESDLPVNRSYIEGISTAQIHPFFSSRWLNAVLVEAEEEAIMSVLDYSFVSSYEFVAPDSRLSKTVDPFEISFNERTPMVASKDAGFQLESLKLDKMIEDGYTGLGVCVAILDAGFYTSNHSDIFKHIFENNRIIDTRDFVRNQQDPFKYDDHGTNVLSCIGAKHEDLTGSAQNASFALYLTEDPDSEYKIEEFNWLLAAERADSLGVDIISSSLGYNVFDDQLMDYSYSQTDGKSSIISKAAKGAIDRGILVVNSAGNEGNNKEWPYIIFPADVDQVLVVGAVDKSLKYASFSSIGPTVDKRIKPDVTALGRSVTVYLENNRIDKRSGTSYSTPLIAGFAASLWQKYPELTNLELKELIVTSASNYLKPNNKTGYGIPNYDNIGIHSLLSVDDVMNEEVIVYPNPFSSNSINVKVEKEYAQRTIDFMIYSPNGHLVNKTTIGQHKKGNIYELEVGGNTKGVYVLRVITGGMTKNVKLLRY